MNKIDLSGRMSGQNPGQMKMPLGLETWKVIDLNWRKPFYSTALSLIGSLGFLFLNLAGLALLLN